MAEDIRRDIVRTLENMDLILNGQIIACGGGIIKKEIRIVMYTYAVLTYFLANCLSPNARDSVSLFLNPFPNPISNIATHDTKDVNVNHTP